MLQRGSLVSLLLVVAVGGAGAAVRKASYESSDGVLEVIATAADRFAFHLQTTSAVGDFCDLDDGDAFKTTSGSYAFDDKQGCRIEFVPLGSGGITAEPTDECQAYCGANAGLRAEFRIRPSACAAAAVAAARERFKSLYGESKYRQAGPGLEKMLDACGFFIPLDELSAERGDVVLAWLNAGNKKRCLAQIARAREENPALEPANRANLAHHSFFEREERLSRALVVDEKRCAQLPGP